MKKDQILKLTDSEKIDLKYDLEQSLRKIEAEIERDRDILKPIEKRLEINWNKKEKILEKLGILKVDSIKRSEKIDWEYILKCKDDDEGQEIYRYKIEMVESLGFQSFGYMQENMQRCLTIYIRNKSKEDIEKYKKSISLLFPYMKPISGIVTIKIMDNGDDFKNLNIKDLDNVSINSRCYDSQYFDDSKKFSLEKALEYISENYWYGEPYRSRD